MSATPSSVACEPRRLLKRDFGVVCHDAGAANLIIGWVQSAPDVPCRVHVSGPALTLWTAAFPHIPILSFDDVFAGISMLLSGTGWASDLEHKSRIVARGLRIPSVAAIDHWVNYPQRFEREGMYCLPDEIWVADSYALEIANKQLPQTPARLLPNYYLRQQLVDIAGIRRRRSIYSKTRILYVLEPIRQKWDTADTQLGEFQALDYFLLRLNALGLDQTAQIRLRPHPSDPPGKYDAWLASHLALDITLAPEESLAAAVAWADWVVGCQSFALVIAAEAGKSVASTIPPWAPPCTLPHASIIHLSALPDAQ